MSRQTGEKQHEASGGKEKTQRRAAGRFEPYGNAGKRYRVFVSNIPFELKWQALKDLMKEKVGDVTYVESLVDAEGKSSGCAIVEFKTEELMQAAVEKVHNYNLNGRPLKVKEDLSGEFARRAAQRLQGGAGPMGGRNVGVGMGQGNSNAPMANIPPSILNNTNIPDEIVHGLRTGQIGNGIFVANLDYKVGWKKLKEVFSMAGSVVRADIMEDKDGNSRGLATITFEMPIEAVQAVSMFNGQLLFNRVMHVKLDEKSQSAGDFTSPERQAALPRGLSGVGLGLGPGGLPIDSSYINRGGAATNGGLMSMTPRGMSGDEGYGRFGMGRMEGGSLGTDWLNSKMDGMGGDMGRMSSMERMGMTPMERMCALDRMGSGLDRMSSGSERLGMGQLGSGVDSSNFERPGQVGFDHMRGGMGFSSQMDMKSNLERMSSSFDLFGSSGNDRLSSSVPDRMTSTLDRMSSGDMGGQFERLGSMDRGGMGNEYGRDMMSGGGAGATKGCQVFVRNLPFEYNWKMLKDVFNACGPVQYANVRMENGKSKGCGVVRFEDQAAAERACQLMNGHRLSGREIDVRMDRNA